MKGFACRLSLYVISLGRDRRTLGERRELVVRVYTSGRAEPHFELTDGLHLADSPRQHVPLPAGA